MRAPSFLPTAALAAMLLSLGPAVAQAPAAQRPPAQRPATQTPAAAQTQDSRLQGLHDALRLSAGQEPAWRKFEAAASTDQAQEQAREQRAAQMMPTLTAPRRVDLSIALLRSELAALEARGAAVKVFYAVLTPTQQATFDQQTAQRQEEQ